MKKQVIGAVAALGLVFGASSAMAGNHAVIAVAGGFLDCYKALGAGYDSTDQYHLFQEDVDGDNYGGYVADNMTALKAPIIEAFTTTPDPVASPYDALFSANTAIPAGLATNYPSYVGTPFNYAIGELYVWSYLSTYDVSNGNIYEDSSETPYYLNTTDNYKYVTCSSGGTYGAAGLYALDECWSVDSSDIVSMTVMSDVVKTIKGVLTPQYPIGFVGNAQVYDGNGNMNSDGHSTYYKVPSDCYETNFTQAAIRITFANDLGDPTDSTSEAYYLNEFMTYVTSAAGRAIIAGYGYTLP